jgi:bifunctional non-homologous end joining protein LigD
MAKKTPAKKGKSAAEEVDKQLERYRAMRDFAMTAEPSGGESGKAATKQGNELPFVVQKHAATRLHYDFRLGWRGVLKSWAVTKGPSYFPGDKRLAVEVEDHPMDYGGFEGAIPKGQYGGGTVMVWDQGTWEPQGDVDEMLRTGRLKFILHGKKLMGKWTLVRMGGHAAREDKPNWLLIKEHDGYERSADAEPITEEAPDSAVTGRDMGAIAKAEDHVWQSHEVARGPNRSRLTLRRKQASGESKTANSKAASAPDRSAILKEAPREAMPAFIPPQLASTVDAPPSGESWLHELKLDGYRIQAHVEEQKRGGRKVVLYSRNGLDWTNRMPDVAHAAASLPVKAAMLDGEVVVLDEKGNTSFADLQAAFEEGKHADMTYFVFDVLHLDGHNVRGLSLMRRKEILQGLTGEIGDADAIRYSEHIRGEGAAMFSSACKVGAEGVISKAADGKYSSDRSKNWLKAKCVHQQEFVIAGFTPPSDGGPGIGALLLGYYQDGKLVYAGRTGTGFTQESRRHLRKELDKLRTAKPAFADPPRERDAIWVEPKLVAEVSFASWTAGGMVRQASFQGFREDKPAKEVVREEAESIAKPERKSKSQKPAVAAHGTTRAADSAAPVNGKAVVSGKAPATSSGKSEVDGVPLTHPDKILDEDSRLTKLQLAQYYFAVSGVMLPHIAGRPLSLVRCPEGSGKPCFFQKHVSAGLPAGVASVPVRSKSGGAAEQYITLDNAKGLIGLAQMGVLEIHPWGSRNDALETPDQVIFDLDPDEGIAWKQLVASAFEVRDLLEQLKLESFVKSTGGKGLHIVAPIKPEREWPEVKGFAHRFVRMMESANPKLYLTKMTKAARKNRIYLDYLRNERGATAVAPYSPRARRGARVAMPLSWNELKTAERPEFAVANCESWKARLKHDPWAKLLTLRQSLTSQAIRAVRDFAA